MVAACPSTAQGQHSGYRQRQGVLARSVCRGSPGNSTQRDGQVLLRYLVVQAPPRGSAGSRPSTVPPGSGGWWPGRPRLAAPARTRRCRGRGSVRVGTCRGRPTAVRRGCGPRGRAAPRARRRVGLCCGRGLDGRAACVAGHVRRMLRSLGEAGSASGHSSLASCCPRTRASASSPCSRPLRRALLCAPYVLGPLPCCWPRGVGSCRRRSCWSGCGTRWPTRSRPRRRCPSAGRTPPEIAIASLAGLVADRNGKPGGFEF
jgi:hypothetical protein